ncbi:MAG: tRNA (adenosine(37)-N6)-threonylcarbamoyltransferase complex dimerization subunit type 1 TsaB [Candidatus Omnitrophica bacterium]|nr:tRNA (adenosine(37)-N6)-threonylcarbamoyltransferase complex dimerization subunit type 1 TsaB [Candidatus Omnitrophota bacterium]
MKILAIDTTTKFLCLGAYDNEKIYEYNFDLGKLQSALLLVTIKRVLEALSWKISQIDYFACGVGPGSFTGLRVGLSTIKGLAWSLKKPVLAIPTLDILAKNAEECTAPYIMPVIDAKRKLIYCSIYSKKDKEMKRIVPYMLLCEKDFLKKVRDKSVIFGDALNLYDESFKKNLKNCKFLDKDYWGLLPRHLIALSLERVREKKIDDCFGVKPIYLYPKDCQIKNA